MWGCRERLRRRPQIQKCYFLLGTQFDVGLPCPSSSAEGRFSMSMGHTWGEYELTSPFLGSPCPLLPLAWWYLHLLLRFSVGGRNLMRSPAACPTPRGNPAYGWQSNHAVAKVHHSKSKGLPLSCRQGCCAAAGKEPPESLQGSLFQ